MEYYLDEIYKRDYLDYFGMFALGSVVPVMINQDYKTLVDMISIQKNYWKTNHCIYLVQDIHQYFHW